LDFAGFGCGTLDKLGRSKFIPTPLPTALPSTLDAAGSTSSLGGVVASASCKALEALYMSKNDLNAGSVAGCAMSDAGCG
jgi:hypothetical protein